MNGTESIVAEHSQDLVRLLTWMLLGMGTAFFTLFAWVASQFLARLTGIEAELKETNRTLTAFEDDFREDISEIKGEFSHMEVRVSNLETKMAIYHGEGRRETNGNHSESRSDK